MPEISRFYGIVITMYFRDHPPAHFHVKYGEFRAQFSIAELKILNGQLPSRVTALVLEWAFQHRDKLQSNWDCLISGEAPSAIEPLA